MADNDQRIVLVTGATDGIGKLTAQRLADMGDAVLIHGRRPEKVEVYLATAPELAEVSGAYFDRKSKARAHDQAYDEQARTRLWQRSLALTGLATHRESGGETTIDQWGNASSPRSLPLRMVAP